MSVAGAGDLHEDGFSELIVSVPNGWYFLVFRGSATGLTTFQASPWVSQTMLGWVNLVSGLGDVNGDGTPDVAVGSSNGVHIYHGNP